MVYAYELKGLSDKGWETIHVFSLSERPQAWDLGREYVTLGFFLAFDVERLWRSA